ncbi:class I fructose-bisphosphate aldolase [Halopelagius inordinatus]|nr:fructose-1,6-bisphosphate aldolase [Halopelagius inordinatus]
MTGSLGSAVVVALDHGLHWGVFDGFEDRRRTLEAVLEGGPDGILASVPFLEQHRDLLDDHPSVYTIGTVDIIHDSTIPGEQASDEIHRQVFDLEDAARVGADAVKACLIYGRNDPGVLGDNLEFAARIARNGRHHGLEVVLEPTLWGPRIEDDLDADLIGEAARIGAELGPDILKLYYPGDADAFAPIVDRAPSPVYVAGGPLAESESAVLEMTADAVDAGADGVIYGRNVWQHEDPASVVEALKDIVHDGATPDESLARFDR